MAPRRPPRGPRSGRPRDSSQGPPPRRQGPGGPKHSNSSSSHGPPRRKGAGAPGGPGQARSSQGPPRRKGPGGPVGPGGRDQSHSSEGPPRRKRPGGPSGPGGHDSPPRPSRARGMASSHDKPAGDQPRRLGSSKAASSEGPGGPERLQKLLAHAGIASRRSCEEYILKGRVSVNGQIVRELGTRVDPRKDRVEVDGQRVQVETPVYLAVNKPKGYVSTNSDPSGRPRVVDLVPEIPQRVYSVGRLDEMSVGLVLLTNDGELANKLTHPKFGIEKIYRVIVAGHPSREVLDQLVEGVWLAEGKARAKHVRSAGQKGDATILEMVLAEGKNREVRRMLAKLGHKVMSLTRVAVGPIALKGLKPGQYRFLTSYEVDLLQKAAAGIPVPSARTGDRRDRDRVIRPGRPSGPGRSRPGGPQPQIELGGGRPARASGPGGPRPDHGPPPGPGGRRPARASGPGGPRPDHGLPPGPGGRRPARASGPGGPRPSGPRLMGPGGPPRPRRAQGDEAARLGPPPSQRPKPPQAGPRGVYHGEERAGGPSGPSVRPSGPPRPGGPRLRRPSGPSGGSSGSPPVRRSSAPKTEGPIRRVIGLTPPPAGNSDSDTTSRPPPRRRPIRPKPLPPRRRPQTSGDGGPGEST
jgi:23S rRNA pseudouridine2605 synthase